jgi:PAS domain S-box-containing protein
VDPSDGRIIRCNRALTEMLGYSVVELEQLTIQAISEPEDYVQDREKWEEMIVGRAARYQMEKRYRHKDGRLIWGQLTVSAVRDAKGALLFLLGMMEDITERKHAETELQSSEQRYRSILQGVQAGVIVHGADRRITASNGRATELLGVPAADMNTRIAEAPEWMRVHADGAPFAAADLPYRRAFATGKPVRDVILGVHRLPTDQPLWLLVDANPVLAASGAVSEVIVTFMDVTARIHAEQKLRDNASFATDVLDSLTDHVVVLDGSGTIIAVNEAWRRFGRDNGAGGRNFVGCDYVAACLDLKSAVDTAGAAAAGAGVRDVLEGRETIFSLEYRCDSPAEIRWFRMRVSPLGGRHGVVVSHHDISETKRGEAELLGKTALLEAQVNSSNDGIIIVDPVGRKILQNQRASDLLHIPPHIAENKDDAVQLRWVAGMTKDPEGFGRRVAQLYAHPDDTGSDEVELKDGTTLERYSSPVLGRDGKRYGRIWSFHDLTERKRDSEALRASEKRFRALFDQAAVGVAQADAATGRFVQVNKRFSVITGYSQEELTRMTFGAITHPDDVSASQRVATEIKAGAIREFTSEKRYVRKDGSEVWVGVTVSAMWAPGETPDAFIAIVQDITGRKALEEQFRQTQKMEAIGTLAGGIAHDFNNILSAIGGYTELAGLVLVDNPKVRRYLESIIKATGRAANLVRQILAFSRQQPPERQVTELQPVVIECLQLLRAAIPSSIAIDSALATDVPAILADSTQIHQVLMNLGTNACYAMKDTSGRLEVRLERMVVDGALAATHPQLHPGVYARVSFSDTGSGMSPATLRRIFEPFFTTKPPGAGTGLGLAVVHGIMDTHGGAITVESEPGRGTVFRLYFPEYTGQEIAAPGSAPPVEPVPKGNGERVLFVDDEEQITQLSQIVLEQLGYVVEVAADGATAIAMVESDPPRFDAVVTDQTMPGMTGLEMAARLSRTRPGLPILLSTGYSLALTGERLAEAGVRQLLLKPVTVRTLGVAVKAAISSRGSTNGGTPSLGQ